MKRIALGLFLVLISFNSLQAKILPRTVIALYDSEVDDDIWFTYLHQFAEMPINHLGLKLEYHDVQQPLPNIAERSDVLGIIVWFLTSSKVPGGESYINWANSVIDAGKKFVVIGDPGFGNDNEHPISIKKQNTFWNRLGLEVVDDWTSDTYNVEFPIMDRRVVEFERKLDGVKSPYKGIKPVGDNLTIYLLARKHGDKSSDTALVVSSPKGAFVHEGYYKYEISTKKEHFRQLYINPFTFFRIAFDVNHYPKPDTTTLVGRRLYYSHIDGDGWNSVSLITKYRRNRTLCARVILDEAIIPFPDLPVTVAPVAADIDLEWVGSDRSIQATRDTLKLPQVELGTHSFSHPFKWKFFKYYTPEAELPYLSKYPMGSWEKTSFLNLFTLFVTSNEDMKGSDKVTNPNLREEALELHGYATPRAYANKVFSLEMEVEGSCQRIEECAPPDKKVMVFQWPGDCQPYGEAIAETKKAGLVNINGGDNRYDSEYLSYSWIRPLGRNIEGQQQIYASNSNENTYTDLWMDRFFGFGFLPETLENTETPIRLRPINVYYHMYSGEKQASLNALVNNLLYVRKQKVTPVTTSHFASIVEGFYSTEFDQLDQNTWKISDRGKLDTIRFDRSFYKTVDFENSKGVIGQRHLHGSLYVFIDPVVKKPIIALKPKGRDENKHLSLVESRWPVSNVVQESVDKFSFDSCGYGSCDMTWKGLENGHWKVITEGEHIDAVVDDGSLSFIFGETTLKPMKISVEKVL